LSLQLDENNGFELEHAAWQWFWKRSMPITPSRRSRSVNELSKLIGLESIVPKNIHLCCGGHDDLMTMDRVFSVPALTQKVSRLSVTLKTAQDPVLQNLHVFTNFDELSVDTICNASEEVLVALLSGVALLKDITSHVVLEVTNAVLDALWRHASTLEFALVTPYGATALNLYSFYAQCRNLRTLYLRSGIDTEPFTFRKFQRRPLVLL
jgi:hypothetical protein